MPALTEHYSLEDGLGFLEVQGNDFDTVLLYQGEPVAFSWSDCQGSIGQYLIRRSALNSAELMTEFQQLLQGGFDPDKSISHQFGPVLKLFSSGKYELSYRKRSSAYWSIVPFESLASLNSSVDAYWPEKINFVPTQAEESLSREKVEHFKELILAGTRPIVITASAEQAWCQFVIDGHHKLQAYRELNIPPARIEIKRLSDSAISLKEGTDYIGKTRKEAKDYSRNKAGWKSDEEYSRELGEAVEKVSPGRLFLPLLIPYIMYLVGLSAVMLIREIPYHKAVVLCIACVGIGLYSLIKEFRKSEELVSERDVAFELNALGLIVCGIAFLLDIRLILVALVLFLGSLYVLVRRLKKGTYILTELGLVEVTRANDITSEHRSVMRALLQFEEPIEQIRSRLNRLSWSFVEERALVTLERKHVLSVLERYLSDRLPATDVECWFSELSDYEEQIDLDEGYEDVLTEALRLYPPFNSLSKDLAGEWIKKLTD